VVLSFSIYPKTTLITFYNPFDDNFYTFLNKFFLFIYAYLMFCLKLGFFFIFKLYYGTFSFSFYLLYIYTCGLRCKGFYAGSFWNAKFLGFFGDSSYIKSCSFFINAFAFKFLFVRSGSKILGLF